MSQYIVSARKYRPATFASVVGQRHVTDTLAHSLTSGQVAHAYLFCGPRGVGKTTVARIMAKAINCENLGKNGEACGQCASCKSFDVNSSFNIFELDAASNNSVENIRTLVDQVRVPPSQGQYKVYIIDEVHMLSTAAFNAFLKTLEEPPPYVKFILATTEKHKILPTILSRCQSFDFRRIPVKEITAHLRSICETEKIKAEDDALIIIAQKGDGSLRDSLSIFDRIASQSKGHITYAGVLESLQLLDYDFFFRVTDALLREDLTEIFLILADIQRAGFEGEAFLSGFSEHLRDVLLCKDTATAELLTHGEKIKTRYLHQAESIRKSSLVSYLDHINQCEIHYNRALHKWLHIEMALVRMCYLHRQNHDTAPQPVAEKKKFEPLTPPITPVAASSSTQTQPEETTVKKAEPVPAPTEVSNARPLTLENGSRSKSGLIDTAVSLGIPMLKRTDNIKQETAELIAQEMDKAPVLELATVMIFWKDHAEGHSSPSMRQTMNESIVEVRGDNIIHIRTGNQTGKNRLNADTNLLEGLRELVKKQDLQIIIEIDPNLIEARKSPNQKNC